MQHVEESLSLAYVQAIAGAAGVALGTLSYDYGIDGSFRPIKKLGKRRMIDGYALDFQLKASTRCQVEPTHIVYDLEAKTFNDLVDRDDASIPCILILLVLPPQSELWLTISEQELLLRHCCYWHMVTGEPSDNESSVRVRISREQLLTPDTLRDLLSSVSEGGWSYD